MAELMKVDETTAAMTVAEVMTGSSAKRKREKRKIMTQLASEAKESKLKALNDEINSLISYFNEVLSSYIDNSSSLLSVSSNLNAFIALMLEEKRCSYSKLAGDIYKALKDKEGGVTVASVKASVLFVGQRIAYGVLKVDVDVLEDVDESCLWCWEARDLKLLPYSLRGALKIRRLCRKKINERIIAIQDVISSVQKLDDGPSSYQNLKKASDKLGKILSEAEIRVLVESLAQKNEPEIADKEAKMSGTTLVKELEKNKREAEREKKRMDREMEKEKLQTEKEKKRMQQEAEREEKRREKEESEMRKYLKRKQEEADKEQRQKEKEEAVFKKQLAVQKQASIMERFLKKSKTASTPPSDQSTIVVTSGSDVNPKESTFESVSLLMDSALQRTNSVDIEEIRKSHMNSWRLSGLSLQTNKLRWGTRQKPKTQLVKEIKLTTNKGPTNDDDMCVDNLVDGWAEISTDDKSCQESGSVSSHRNNTCVRRKQLLQFDKSNRPAFYGIWPKKSHVIGLRHPFKRDPELDYEIDSDEEWEEEEPGESLSDSEKEDEDVMDEGSCKVVDDDDDEESDDEFFVPDGYLSENEGVENERSQKDLGEELTRISPSCKAVAESEECSAWTKQQKYLHNLTEHALRKNQPLVIVNLMQEKTHLLSAEDLSGTSKIEQMCLQALTMLVFPGGSCIEVPPTDVNLQAEDDVFSTPKNRGRPVASVVASTIPDSDLPKIVSAIHSYPHSSNRVLDSLQQTFPDIPKSHLRNKVREISDYFPVDNRWRVKKEILDKLGMTTPPEKTRRGTKNIATFFSKRCLPPADHNICESSPETVKKPASRQKQEHHESIDNA